MEVYESWSRLVGPRLVRAIFQATARTKRTQVEQAEPFRKLEQARPGRLKKLILNDSGSSKARPGSALITKFPFYPLEG